MAVLAIDFTSCDKDDDEPPFLGAIVNVTVKNMLGTAKESQTVYLYYSEVTSETLPADAK